MNAGSQSELQFENEHFRAVKWTIEPNGAIPMHRHEHAYVVVPMITQRMHVVQANGSELVNDLVEGQSYTRPAGSEHQVENRNSDSEIVFIEIERLT
ncbi:cupin domain-containing protein [Gulosibacter molinativorax]|uniref:Cupin n=1 Tax=Gulosibacter molinativorax TaxID=256821 RepID=A0ABT7CA62_9MICO|nr:cupin [Gulosibacter molinativorax]MDJ1372080.1 cupin [Gulosibacter molinativorax]QUY63871.1 Protein export cytoplasm protein SecA ATPase RNA helicase [Gulosibacter molinativorax]